MNDRAIWYCKTCGQNTHHVVGKVEKMIKEPPTKILTEKPSN